MTPWTLSRFESECSSSLSSLRNFCYEFDIDDVFENMYDDDEYNEDIRQRIDDLNSYNNWDEVLSYLESIPETGYDWYELDPYSGQWYGLSEWDTGGRYDAALEIGLANGFILDDESNDENEEGCSGYKTYMVQDDNKVSEDFISILNLEIA